MFDSQKLEKFAISIFPYIIENSLREELSNAIGAYGVDSGDSILQFFSKHFNESFIRQFFNGGYVEFIQAYEAKLNQWKNLRYL